MSIRKSLLGFSVFAVASVLVTITMWNTLSRNVNGPTGTYSAIFTDAQGLRPGDDVVDLRLHAASAFSTHR